MPPPNTAIFTDAEIEKMRLYVTEHDKRSSANEFDLNNPPRTNYSHQHFPKVVYSLDADGKPVAKKVHDAQEHEVAIDGGWFNEPQAEAQPEEVELDAASQAEVDALNKKLADIKAAKATKSAKRRK